MALKIYKPGQGYWTRLMTFLGFGILALAGVAWLIDEFTVIENQRVRVTVQASTAVIFIALFGWLMFRIAYIKPRSSDFMIATEGEMKKVNWPARREVFGSTWVVIICMLAITAVLYVSDLAFVWFFETIGILPKT